MLQRLLRRCLGPLRKSNMSGARKISSRDNGKSTMYATTSRLFNAARPVRDPSTIGRTNEELESGEAVLAW
ncbi:hypothetical protein V498_00892 [Pseudogymnoascus sp. VKM F-4517 (FW-2822)]|nr:hypothetical protein V498_00892 [Pseudogymnoascus sp. VKM F-4517 (FW-2822)]